MNPCQWWTFVGAKFAYTYGMERVMSFLLVFGMAAVWFSCTVLLLLRVSSKERRAMRRARKASRMKAGRGRHLALPAGNSVTERRRLKALRRHSPSGKISTSSGSGGQAAA